MAGILFGLLMQPIRQPRNFKERIEPLNTYSDAELITKYRFDAEGIQFITDLVRDAIVRTTRRNHSLTPTQVMCIALRFYACGSFQEV